MALKFEDVFTGKGCRSGEVQQDAFVDRLATFLPETRTMPTPPRPGGVAIAAIVSLAGSATLTVQTNAVGQVCRRCNLGGKERR